MTLNINNIFNSIVIVYEILASLLFCMEKIDFVTVSEKNVVSPVFVVFLNAFLDEAVLCDGFTLLEVCEGYI